MLYVEYIAYLPLSRLGSSCSQSEDHGSFTKLLSDHLMEQ